MLQYTGMMLLEEMASIFLTPYLLIFIVPEVIIQHSLYFTCCIIEVIYLLKICLQLQRVDEILQFIDNFTADVEGVGHVCR